MIFIMSAKQWDKNKKKLIIPKDYFIFDATDDDEAKLDRFTNTITMSGFNPPAKLVKLISKNEDLEDIIDIDKMEKLEDNFFNGLQFNNAVLSTVAGQLENDVNIFIVLRNKVFKNYRKRILRAFTKKFEVDFTFVVIFSGDVSANKKELKKSLSSSEVKELKELLGKREKEMAKSYNKKKKKRNKF